MKRLLSLVHSASLLKAPNPPIREFIAAGADILNGVSTVHPGIKIEPLLHKNKNMYHLWDGDGTVLEKKKYLGANKKRSTSCVCRRMVQLSGVKNLPSPGQSIFTRAS